MTALSDGPTAIDPSNLVGVAAIRSMLEADVLSDLVLDSPLVLGFLLSGISAPTTDLGDGSVARVLVASGAFDANEALAVVTLPGTAWLFMIGVSFLYGSSRLRREGSSICPRRGS
jgi:hypothetical protein